MHLVYVTVAIALAALTFHRITQHCSTVNKYRCTENDARSDMKVFDKSVCLTSNLVGTRGHVLLIYITSSCYFCHPRATVGAL